MRLQLAAQRPVSSDPEPRAPSFRREQGKRIRASVLPYAGNAKEWTKAISWPAFRVGHDNARSSQHRLRGCFWQMRYPMIKAGSDLSIAVLSYWTDLARGQPAILPDMKR